MLTYYRSIQTLLVAGLLSAAGCGNSMEISTTPAIELNVLHLDGFPAASYVRVTAKNMAQMTGYVDFVRDPVDGHLTTMPSMLAPKSLSPLPASVMLIVEFLPGTMPPIAVKAEAYMRPMMGQGGSDTLQAAACNPATMPVPPGQPLTPIPFELVGTTTSPSCATP